MFSYQNADENAQGSSGDVSNKTDDGSKSLLTKQEVNKNNFFKLISLNFFLQNYTTYILTTNEEIKSVGFVFTILRKVFGDDFDAKSTISQVAFTKDYTVCLNEFEYLLKKTLHLVCCL